MLGSVKSNRVEPTDFCDRGQKPERNQPLRCEPQTTGVAEFLLENATPGKTLAATDREPTMRFPN